MLSVSSHKYSSSHSMRQHINELVVTDGEQIICVPPQQDIQLAASLGSEKSHALAMFQALTGCDTVSGFARDGKNQNCMSVQNLLLVLTGALLTLRSRTKHADH